jgi:hypothetical protein
MLVVVLLLPLSLAMDDGEFDHGGGGGSGGSSGSGSGGGGGQQLVAKAAGNKSVDSHMTACDDKSGRQKNNATTNQQWEQ